MDLRRKGSRKLDRKPHATLSDRRARGGVIGGKGYGFQAAYIISRIPLWLADNNFVQFLQEGAGDVDVRFNRADGEERWYVQVKNHEVKVTEARQVLAQFREMDVGSSGTYTRFTLACPGLTGSLKQLRAAVEELRGIGHFFRPGKDPILDNTWTDLDSLVHRLRLPVGTDFLADKVYFDTDLAGLTDDDSLRDLFVGRLLRLDICASVTFEEATRAYERLALRTYQTVRETCFREQVEAIIWEALGETEERLLPEYDDYVTRIGSVIADLGSVLTLETALYLTRAILEESPWPRERIWESCQDALSRREVCLETLLFRARVECYYEMEDAVDTLEDLVNACGSRSEVLEEAASLRFRLADDTARRAHDEGRSGVQAEFDEASRHLRSLYKAEPEAAGSRKAEIGFAQDMFRQAESRE